MTVWWLLIGLLYIASCASVIGCMSVFISLLYVLLIMLRLDNHDITQPTSEYSITNQTVVNKT